MKTDFLLAITQLAAERKLPKEVVFSAVEAALVTAFKKDEVGARQNISVKIHPVTGDVRVYTIKVVVEEPEDEYQEISLGEARRLKKDVEVGEAISFETTSFHAGRIAAQTAKQVVLQRLREAEREFIFGEYSDREGDIVSGVVQRIEPRQVVIDLGKAEGILPVSEQVRTERYRIGQRLKLYLMEVNRTNRGPRLIMSRSHPNLVRRLFELEVPEIHNGMVELKAVAREAGYRSKVAVAAKQEGLDPVGSCVGLRGVRIQNVVNELNGERIDVIQWDDDPTVFIGNALSPAQVFSVHISEEENTAIVVVPDNQLSLAIGREGQNARLGARITGWRIDIKSATAAEAERIAVEVKPAAAKEAVLAGEKRRLLAISTEQYEMPLEQLGLSARVFNSLLGAGITKVGEVLEKDDKELLGVKGFGKKALSELKERLEALELGPAVVGEEVEAAPLEGEVGEAEGVAAVEELVGVREVEGVEKEAEVIPYEAPPELVEVGPKPQIRFAEDIFGARVAASEAKKKGKKKHSRDERADEAKGRKGKKAVVVSVDEEFEDTYDGYSE